VNEMWSCYGVVMRYEMTFIVKSKVLKECVFVDLMMG